MDTDLDRVIAHAGGLDNETRNAIVHLAAEQLVSNGALMVIRSQVERDGTVFDLYRDKHTGKMYVTRRPDLTPQARGTLEKKLAGMLGGPGA